MEPLPKAKLGIALAAVSSLVFFSVTQLKPKPRLSSQVQPEIKADSLGDLVSYTLSSLAGVYTFTAPETCSEGTSQDVTCNAENKTKQFQYTGCEIDSSDAKFSGNITLNYSNGCDIKKDDTFVTRTINLVRTDSDESTLTTSSTTPSKVTNVDGSVYRAEIPGTTKTLKDAKGVLQFSVAIHGLTELNSQSPGMSSFLIQSGKIEAIHSLSQVVGTFEIKKPLKIEHAKCCHPIDGQLEVSLSGKTSVVLATLTYGATCGEVTAKTGETERVIEIPDCN